MQVKKETHVTGKTGAQRSATKGKGRYDCIWLGFPHMLFRLARLFEQGIESGYAPGNWKKGTDLRRWLEGGCRHLSQFAEGLTNEDHLIAGIWNLLCLGETRHLIETGVLPIELDNLPFTSGGIDPSKSVLRYEVVFDPASPEGDESVDWFTAEMRTAHEEIKIKELQKRVADGELLSDRENEILHGTDCQRSHPFVSHTLAGPIRCTCDACKYWSKGQPPPCDEPTCTTRRSCSPECETKPVEPRTFYVCGPMTGMKDFNFPLFDQVTELARSQGLSVISPAELDREHGIDPSVDPDSVERARRADPNLIQTIVQRDTQVIVGLERDKGDGLILLPGWEKSHGGRAEIALALWMGLSFKRVVTTWHGQACEPEIKDTYDAWVGQRLFYQCEGK